MANNDVASMAHLMRRAGFGAQYHELEARASKGYEAMVEELLNPTKESHGMDLDLGERYFIEWNHFIRCVPEYIAFRMVNSYNQLEEKMTLFWHGILCTADSKGQSQVTENAQMDMLRRCGMGNFKDLLLEISRDPAMVYFLDNCLSHKDSINENYGRELLELFSLGVGMDGKFNYTEDDVKECARAFTGWTIANAIPRYPYGRHNNTYLYNQFDHDDGEKIFLGETGPFNGEDIIAIIAKQPSTARFISRHLYNFFVADEPAVAMWQITPPQDPETIKALEDEYFRSGYEIRSMLRVLFNSDAFKSARFAKVKSPAELVAGTLRLVGDFTKPRPRMYDASLEIRYMGQDLLNPPTVEGWHTGKEWIDSGTLLERINFAAGQMGAIQSTGIRAIINRLRDEGPTVSAERLVDGCLEMIGGYGLMEETRALLLNHASQAGALDTGTEEFAQQVGQMLQLIVSTQEYQFA